MNNIAPRKLDEMNDVVKRQKLPKLTQEEIENQNSTKSVRFTVKNVLQRILKAYKALLVNSIEHLNASIMQTLSQNEETVPNSFYKSNKTPILNWN